ncbi:MAG TPA: twin-arginine translocase TatA/TatE family subunit [Thermoanaerobaculia bacterium]|nr:twin-arginine translocase TatA/TatE family subunit [Thermoanaerobaculia bacterium]
MGPIGIPELLIILVIVVLLFGATRLPNIGKGLGEGIRNFKKGIKSDDTPERERLSERAEDRR